MIFLIEYDRSRGELVQMKSFVDGDKDIALASRLNLELERYTQGIDREIVILEAASETAIRRTHRRYFETLLELSRELRFAN
jgi:hypothetical protein